jgi:uncharacterized radical SAM superfamily Fe-S cluster-containing enzyme
MTLVAGRRVRDHVLHEITRSLCAECGAVIDARVLIRDGAVFLRKRCPRHGWQEALVSSDAAWYLYSLKYNKPGAIPLDFSTAVETGCPTDCGLCPEHQQHTCIGVIEIGTDCNLSCPTCFADSGPGYRLSLGEVESILDRYVETEGHPEVVQISGGEPTLHPDVLAILEAAQGRGIRHIMLNTNGIRLALDPQFVRDLARLEPVIYLQFDGVEAASYQALRGSDLRPIKQQALDNLARAGVYAVLVATVARGINDHEVGSILQYALRHPAVLGVCYQPVAFTGRSPGCDDALSRVTVPDVIGAIEEQTGGLFRTSDFRPIPCPYPTCSACTYAYVEGGSVTPIPRILNVDDYLDLALNRTAVDLSTELAESLDGLWSMSAVMGGERTTDALDCAACGVELPGLPGGVRNRERFFMVQIHSFMDEHNFDVRRLMRCCVHQLLPDGRAIPLRGRTRRELAVA